MRVRVVMLVMDYDNDELIFLDDDDVSGLVF